MGSDGPLLVDTGSGLNIRYRGRNLYSPASPILAAEKRADAYKILPETLLFVPSPLLFYGIDHLLASVPDGVLLLCVEVDQSLMRLSLENSSTELAGNPFIHYVRTDSVDEVLKELHEIGIGRFRRVMEIVVNGGRSIRRELYSRMYRAVEYEVQSHWRNRMTLMHMAHLWIKNYLLNLPEICSGGDVAKKRINLPIVVAGAGESLEGAIPLLRQHREKYYLLAVDTAVRSLAGNGMTPDAVVVLDAQAANLSDFIGFDGAEATLIADVTAYPECIRLFSGERWFFLSDFARLELFDRARASGLLPAAIPPLGSVGIAALYFAHALTSRAVIFAGLDFSYRAGKTHARGAPSQVASELRSSRLSPMGTYAMNAERPHRSVPDKRGTPVWTDNALSGYSAVLGLYVTDKERFFDLGGGGLPTPAPRIEDEVSIQRVLARTDWSDDEGGYQLTGNGSSPASKEQLPARLRAAEGFLENEVERLRRSIELAITALESPGETRDSDTQLSKMLQEEAFVYLHFPDAESAATLHSDSFLKRFVEAAETAERWMERSLSRIRSLEE